MTLMTGVFLLPCWGLALIPSLSSAAPFEACSTARLWASNAVDAHKGGASEQAILRAIRASNQKNKSLGEAVSDKFITQFLADLKAGKYNAMPSGSSFFDGATYQSRFTADCIESF